MTVKMLLVEEHKPEEPRRIAIKDLCDFCGCWVEPIQRKRNIISGLIKGNNYYYTCPECCNVLS